MPCAPSGPAYEGSVGSLFDQLVGEKQKIAGNGQPECLRGVEVYDKLKRGRMLNGKIRGTYASEYFVDVDRPLPELIDRIEPV